jgi:hypothetical protein
MCGAPTKGAASHRIKLPHLPVHPFIDRTSRLFQPSRLGTAPDEFAKGERTMPSSVPVASSSAGAGESRRDDLLAAGGLVVRRLSELPIRLRPRQAERATADDEYDIHRY